MGFIAHGRTLTCVGGKAGMAKTRDDSLLEIKLFAKPDPSSPTGVSPTGFGELKRPGQDPIAVAIDRWQPAIAPAHLAPIALPGPGDRASELAWLHKCWEQPAIEVGHETIAREVELTETQQESINLLVSISRKNGPVSAADCQRSSRKLKTLSPESIRELFLIAQAMGLGTVDGDGASARFAASEGD